jgi:hypothetical protein
MVFVVMLEKRDQVNDVLSSLAQRDGIQGLRLDASGCAALRLQGGVALHFEWLEREETLFIYSPIMRLPAQPGQLHGSLLLHVLQFNCLSIAGQCALHPDGQTLLIQQAIQGEHLNVRSLDEQINRLLQARQSLYQSFQSEYSSPLFSVEWL